MTLGVGFDDGCHTALAPCFLIGAGEAVGFEVLAKGLGIVGSGEGDGGDGLLATGERGCGLIAIHLKCGGQHFGCGLACCVIVAGQYRLRAFQGAVLIQQHTQTNQVGMVAGRGQSAGDGAWSCLVLLVVHLVVSHLVGLGIVECKTKGVAAGERTTLVMQVNGA